MMIAVKVPVSGVVKKSVVKLRFKAATIVDTKIPFPDVAKSSRAKSSAFWGVVEGASNSTLIRSTFRAVSVSGLGCNWAMGLWRAPAYGVYRCDL